ncbi:hypothetical protein [Paraliobacillus zengyii]|nr:hypothetical protein [Paraliobacillus zengyii]
MINIFVLFVTFVLYIGIPLAIIFLLKWIYQMKKNSDLQIVA